MQILDDKKLEKLECLIERLENCGVTEYVKYYKKPVKILWMNFMSGVARGLGFTIGTSLVIAVVYKIISRIISMNIPVITEGLQRFVEMIQGKV